MRIVQTSGFIIRCQVVLLEYASVQMQKKYFLGGKQSGNIHFSICTI